MPDEPPADPSGKTGGGGGGGRREDSEVRRRSEIPGLSELDASKYVAIYWGGLAIGGFRSTVDPERNTHWFLGQICAGGHTLVVLGINRTLWDANSGSTGLAWGKSHDIGIVYAGVAGLLNLLAVFDAIVRSISGEVRERDPRERDRPEREPGGG